MKAFAPMVHVGGGWESSVGGRAGGRAAEGEDSREQGLSVAAGEADEPQAVVRVTDTGMGIPANMRDKIFERFFRVDKSRSKETGGTGLGLAIVKHAVMYHKGTIEVESEEGKGTIFTVRIPAATNS